MTRTQATTYPTAMVDRLALLRSQLKGVTPLRGKLESWMVAVLESPDLAAWVSRWGSPLNLHCLDPFEANLARLREVGSRHAIDFEVYFARKANKCLPFVEACRDASAGVDTASEQELRESLDARVPPRRLICTAAIKEAALLRLCVEHGVTIAIDNLDELRLLKSLVGEGTARIALRVGEFLHEGNRLETRFGIGIDEAARFAAENTTGTGIDLVGVHFHLDGYDAAQRVSAIDQSLRLIDELRRAGHAIEFLDMGGGFPICYLEDAQQWNDFWLEHEEALGSGELPATFRGHTLGLVAEQGRLYGKRETYPFYQELVSDRWLDSVLSASLPEGGASVAEGIASRNLQLRCEPGRALLEGCGMTVARVVHRKRDRSGDLLVGLAMNRTQCRTSSADFLVDPILVKTDHPDREQLTESGDGYFTGAYCTESEAILLRKLRFTAGVAVGDLVALPNTAGYFMHFQECRSHQFPLATNGIVTLVGTEELPSFYEC